MNGAPRNRAGNGDGGTAGATTLRALALVAPLVCFLGLFFVWPLVGVISASVRNTAIPDALPATAAAIATWDGDGLPGPDVSAALLQDLASGERRTLGAAVGRLNSVTPGFRTLMSRTVRAAKSDAPAPALAGIDARWDDPVYWRTIRDNLAPWTDRNLLAAVDLERAPDGTVVELSNSANRTILLRTLVMGATITAVCAAVGLPYALVAASVGGWRRTAMLVAVLLPLWTSLLVRTAAWYILLQDDGLVNGTLMRLGAVDAPLPLIFNRLGVVIAMVHILLPFMVLPIYSVASTVPRTLMPAAASLGAPPLPAFLRVLLPLVLPGLISGCLLVFMVSIGYYITPALVGGPTDQMISSTIAFYALETANWGMAGALGLILLAATLALYAVQVRLTRDVVPASL